MFLLQISEQNTFLVFSGTGQGTGVESGSYGPTEHSEIDLEIIIVVLQ